MVHFVVVFEDLSVSTDNTLLNLTVTLNFCTLVLCYAMQVWNVDYSVEYNDNERKRV